MLQVWREEEEEEEGTGDVEAHNESVIDSTVPCSFAPVAPGMFLAGYPASLGCDPWLGERGADPGSFGCAKHYWPYDRSDLASAQAWCCENDDCGGVTFQYGFYEARAGRHGFQGGGGNASSWLRLNAPHSPSSELTRWGVFGGRRYGRTEPSAVEAWKLLGATIYEGIGGGFGSAISSLPSLPDGRGPAVTDVGGASTGAVDFDAAAPSVRLGGVSRLKRLAEAANVGDSYRQHPERSTELLPPTVPNRDDDNACGCCQVCSCGCAWDAANDAVARAWGLLIAASDTLGEVASFRYDAIDVGRFVIAGNFSSVWQQYAAAFAKRNLTACRLLENKSLEIIDDYDALLSTDTNFMLGRWQSWARSWADAGADDDIKNNLEYNARNQLTLWGPTGQIADYAKKEWGGLVRSYYRPRYELLFKMAEASLLLQLQATTSSPTEQLSIDLAARWNQSAYAEAVLAQVELPWQTSTKTFPSQPEGDAIAVSIAMYAKYMSRQ